MTVIYAGSRFRAFVAAFTVLTLAGATSWVSAQQTSTPAPSPTAAAPATAAGAPAPTAAAVGQPQAIGAAPATASAGSPQVTGAPAATVPQGTVAAPAIKPPAAPVAKAPVVAKPAAKPAEKPLWTELTKAQQQVLQPLADDWARMESVKKLKWVEIANRFATMKPDEQQRIHERMRNWAVELTPEQRRVARENFANTKKIAPGQKSAQWEEYQQLPEAEKKRLAAAAALKKKQVANLPSSAQSKLPKVEPIKNPARPPAAKPATAPAATATAPGTAVPAANAPVGAAPGAAPATGAAPAATAPATTAPTVTPPVPNGK